MKFSYNQLVTKVDTYLQNKRSTSRLWNALLPEKLFNPELWLWEQRGVAIGAGWGVFWAFAPVPMQTIFAVLCSAATRGNVPISVLSCWISFPGYQVILWPLQWWAGAALLGCLGLSSGVDMELIRSAAAVAPQGMDAMLQVLGVVNLWILGIELLLGCIITSAAAGALVCGLIQLIWRRK